MLARLGVSGFVLLAPAVEGRIQPAFVPTEIRRAQLVDQVRASYPAAARAARVTGVVILDAVISEEGAIDELKLVSGHPLLVNAAFEAVKRWRYLPATRNGTPEPTASSIWIAFPSGSIAAPLLPTPARPAPGRADRSTGTSSLDLSPFEGVWEGEEADRTGIKRLPRWSPKVTWTVALDSEYLTRTEAAGGRSRSVTYELDGSESRADGSDSLVQFANAYDRTKYDLRRRVMTLTLNRIELEERVFAPDADGAGPGAHMAVDEFWELSDEGNRLKVVVSNRVYSGHSLGRYSITYEFERVPGGAEPQPSVAPLRAPATASHN